MSGALRLDPADVVLRIVASSDAARVGEEILVADTATIGRARDCTIVLDDSTVSRLHARVERGDNGTLRLRDLQSGNGVWIGAERRAQADLHTGDRFQIGSTIFECLLRGRGDVASSGNETIIIARPPRTREPQPALGLADEGEPLVPSPHEPLALDDPEWVWYVVSGGLLLYTATLEDGVPGTRTHLFDVGPGELLFGLDPSPETQDTGFFAVARPATRLRQIRRGRLRALAIAAAPDAARTLGHLVDLWVNGLSRSVAHHLTGHRTDERQLRPGAAQPIAPRAKATAAEGPLWIDVWSGGILFDDLVVPRFERRRVLFPLSPHARIEIVGAEFGALAVTPLRSEDAIVQPSAWQGLAVFHAALRECESLTRRFATADEFVRLRQKARHAESARDVAYDAIGSVLRPEPEVPREFLATGSPEPVLRASRLVAQALGLAARPHPDATDDLTYEDRVASIANASGFRTRTVALRDDWWTQDHGPLLGQYEETKTAVALLPAGARAYDAVDPATGARTRVDADVAGGLTSFAYTFYRPFADGAPTAWEVVAFGARGLRADVRTLIVTAFVVGLFGTVLPYLTGRIFDAAIPQADRATLYGFGLAIAASAFATSLFKVVQGVASVRAQARMEYAVQSALWDRLLTLPARFFRAYSAGDLADRAAGVDQIQTLISGAGVAAILGSLSGLFFVVQMFVYNLKLAALAMALTAFFLIVKGTCDYLQLRYQRVEVQIRGRIAGLVLNLITGVSKLRICGAEPHAFRVWAQQFAAQRRIAFKAGVIQSASRTFSTVFPVLSSMAIFLALVFEQQQATERGGPVMTTGQFIAFTTAFGLFVAAMQALGDASINVLRIVPIYERLQPILSMTPEVDRTKLFPGKLSGAIELAHLSFRYHDDGPWIVRDVSLTIAPGEFIAFVGPSGCGKSTLLRLMLGFEKPSTGTIYYDGQDLSSLELRMVRQQMGVVLQVSRVMPTDIYRNIVGLSTRTIDEAWNAAEMAGLADDIRNMPMGMHTYVSEGGGTLSGGQRQRLLIARAIVHRPRLLVLDEATSALDNRTQAIVTASLDGLDATRIVIAHRLSTVVNADRICYLDEGRIAEMGTYQELMARNGPFAQLAKRQMA